MRCDKLDKEYLRTLSNEKLNELLQEQKDYLEKLKKEMSETNNRGKYPSIFTYDEVEEPFDLCSFGMKIDEINANILLIRNQINYNNGVGL